MKKRNILGLVVSIIIILAITLVSACTESKTTPIPLTVISTNQANGAQGVPVSITINATFNREMTPSTITTATFTVKQGGTPISGTVTYAGKTATFTPTTILAFCTIYTATITIGANDLGGNALASDYIWTFFTTCPTSGSAQGIRGGPTTRSHTVPPTINVYNPAAPTVIFTIPVNTATGVAVNSKIYAIFSDALDCLTVNSATFTLMQGTKPVLGTVTCAGITAIFTPTVNLALNTTYTVTITGVRDLAGNLLVPRVWSFTTIASLPLGPLPVDLGTAGNFAILAKSGISNTGITTSITGDIGVSPITDTAITGFGLIRDASNQFSTTSPASLVIGRVYAANMATPTPARMTQAISDMETAYTDAAGRATAPIVDLNAGNLGSLTLAPGLYKFSTGVTIPTDVTLAGGPDDVWIFQISGTLDISSATKVLLSGGALPKNIFWQVTGTTTLNTTSVFNGNILDQTNIRMLTGATLNGRALAQTAVTMDSNTVVKP
jgi:hypothetical protein